MAPALGGLAGLGLSAVFWLPAFLSANTCASTKWFDGRYAYLGHFVYWQQFSARMGLWRQRARTRRPDQLPDGAAIVAFAVLGVLMVWRTASPLRWRSPFRGRRVEARPLSPARAAPLWEVPIVGGLLRTAQFPGAGWSSW